MGISPVAPPNLCIPTIPRLSNIIIAAGLSGIGSRALTLYYVRLLLFPAPEVVVFLCLSRTLAEADAAAAIQAWKGSLDPYLAFGGQARGAGGRLGEGLPAADEDLALAGLDDAVALELTHRLRDGFAGRGEYDRQVLMGEIDSNGRVRPAFPEAFAEVYQQGRQAGRHLAVQ